MKVGIDITETKRFYGKTNKFYQKFFTEKEINYCQKFSSTNEHFAGFFSAKEAIMKSLGYGINSINFLEIEIIHNENNKPFAKLFGKAKEIFDNLTEKNIEISISHTKALATSIAILF